MENTLLLRPSKKSNFIAEPLPLQDTPLRKADTSIDKIDKTIEIVTVPKASDLTDHQKNVGIVLDGSAILQILTKIYKKVAITEINTLGDLQRLSQRHPDLVFSGVKYFDFNGKILWLNDFLDRFEISYIASSRNALEREADKSRAKDIVQKAGIATSRYFVTFPGEHPTEESIPIAFPLFVKPIIGGDSRGVDANSVVSNFSELSAKVEQIQNNQNLHSLVESYLSGKEYSVGIFEDISTGTLTAMPIEIVVVQNKDGNRILDFDTKRSDSEKVIAVTDQEIHKKLSDMAKAAFKALGGKSIGRIDVMMNHDHVPYFIEANLMPGLRMGYFFRACLLNLNMSYEQMILKIARNGLLLASFRNL